MNPPPATRRPYRATPIEVRLMAKVEFEPSTGCWLWSGTTGLIPDIAKRLREEAREAA